MFNQAHNRSGFFIVVYTTYLSQLAAQLYVCLAMEQSKLCIIITPVLKTQRQQSMLVDCLVLL
jgi:hypothetical protein